MNYFSNAVSKLYDVASALVASTRNDLAKKLQSIRDTAYLLYQNTKKKLGCGQTLKDTVENE